jgi:hypothetical protein
VSDPLGMVHLRAIGLAAPGLPSWQAVRRVLRGEASFEYAALASHTPELLPMNERRRATPAVRLAFQAAEDAVRGAGDSARDYATVFASSDADLGIIHRICTALTRTPRLISPTDFHNSVHNAAAGYWHIGVGARTASTSISAHDASFAAGLLEACLQVRIDGQDTLLVAFDLPAPEPLHSARPVTHPASVALVLTRDPGEKPLACLACTLSGESETVMDEPPLESLRTGNPASRALPLLRQIACNRPGRVLLPAAIGRTLAVDVVMP